MSREIPKGTGFYIWKLASVLPVTRLLDALNRAQASWVSIKVADGNTLNNRIDEAGNQSRDDHFLLGVIQTLRSAGIHVGGWPFIYPLPTLKPGSQAGVIGERVEKLDLQHLLIDAEQVTGIGSFWKTLANGTANPQRNYSATQYMDGLKGGGVPLSLPVALSSYRYPRQHAGFPFRQFTHSREGGASFVAQQMYWIGAHNPAEQLEESIRQYKETVAYPGPFVPIGAAFGEPRYDWEPTTDDLEAFIAKAQEIGCPGWGFWSLDYIIKHNRVDWLDAIAGVDAPPEPPAPPPVPVEPGLHLRVIVPVLNIRSGPGTQHADIGDLYEGQIVTAVNIDAANEAWVEFEEGKWAAYKFGGKKFLEIVS